MGQGPRRRFPIVRACAIERKGSVRFACVANWAVDHSLLVSGARPDQYSPVDDAHRMHGRFWVWCLRVGTTEMGRKLPRAELRTNGSYPACCA